MVLSSRRLIKSAVVLTLTMFGSLSPLAAQPTAAPAKTPAAVAKPAAAAAKLPDTIRVKILSMAPDQKVLQGLGKLSRTLTLSAPVDTTTAPVVQLGTQTLSCRFGGATSLVISGDITSSLKNGKVALALSGLLSNGKPVVVSGLPTLLVDTDPPKVDASAVKIGWRPARLYKGDTLIVDISTACKSTDLASVSVAIDSAAPMTAINGKAAFFKVAEGPHKIRITAKDNAGNQSAAAEVAVVIDRTPPDMSKAVVTIGNGKPVVSNAKAGLKVSGITDINGVKTKWYRHGNAAAKEVPADSAIIQLGRDGTDTIEVWAEDSAGNVSARLRKTIARDTRAPSATATVDKLWSSGSASVVWKFDEPMDTAVAAVAKLDSAVVAAKWINTETLMGSVKVDSTFRNGNHQLILISAADPAGNLCGKVTSDITIDTRAPELTPKNVVLNKGNLSISCDSAQIVVGDVTDPSGIAKYRYSLDGKVVADTASPKLTLRKVPDGKHELNLVAIDGAKNASAHVSVAFTVDASRPGIKSSAAGLCDTVTGRIPVTLGFSKPMDEAVVPSLKVQEGAVTDGRWADSVTLKCIYNPEKKGPIDTVRIMIKGGRDRGGLPVEELEAVCAIGTDTIVHLAKVLAAKGSHDDASNLLKRISDSQPYREDIADFWAAESREAKDRNGERQAMERLAKLRPADKELLRSLTNLTSKMGDRKASKSWLKQMMVADGKLDAVSSADYRKEGRSFFQLAPGACIASAKGDEAAELVGDGILAVRTGDLRAAQDAFNSALALDNTCLEAVYNLATLQLLDNKPLDAEAALARCAAADGRFAGNYAVALAMSGKLDQALKLFEERKISLGDPAIAGVYGVLLIRSGKSADALPYLEKASTAGTVERINYAFALYTNKDFQRSQAVFGTCGAAAADSFPEISYGKALAELQLGDKDGAIRDLQAAVAIQPVYLDAQLKLGELLMKNKDHAGARHALTFAARADSTSSAAHQALAAMYKETGETDLARTESMSAARPPQKDSTAMTVAVEQFKNVTQDSSVGWLSVGMAEALSTEMTRFSPYRMLERIQIEAITKRMALKQAVGGETEADESKLQKALGAQAIVTGSYQSVGVNLRIDGRLIEVQTGKILTTGSASGTMADLSRMQRTLALTLAGRSDALELSELPGGVSSDAQQQMALAKKALYSGDAEQAKKLADEALKIDPLALSLAGSMAIAMANEGRGKSMAVLQFDNLTGSAGDAGLGSGIQEALMTNLRKAGNLSIVERSQIDKVTAEIGLGQSGLIQESSASTVGGMLAAGVLLTGGYQENGNKIRITAKLLDAMTAEVLLATDVSGKKDALFELEDQLAVRIIQSLKEAPKTDSASMLDPTQKRSTDTSTTALASEPEADSSASSSASASSDDSENNRKETLDRRLTFFVGLIGMNFRAPYMTANGDAGFHFLNEVFALDGLFDISYNDIWPENFPKSTIAKTVDGKSITTAYRSIEGGAAWNFFGRWRDNDERVSFYQLRAGYKSLQIPELAQRVDTLPPYLRTSMVEDADVTINTTLGIVYAGLGITRKKAEYGSRKSFRFYTDFMWAPSMTYSATENDGTEYQGFTNALMLQHIGGRLGMERTFNGRFGFRWTLETGVRPGVHLASYPNWYNLYLSTKIGVCSSWF